MNPNQPNIPPPANHNPYDFITNPSQPPKRNLFSSLGGGSLRARLLVVAAIALGIVLVLTVLTLIITSGSSSDTGRLRNIVLSQAEIVRLTDAGLDNARDGNVRARAITVKLSVSSQQQSLTEYLEKRGVSIEKEAFTLNEDADTQSKLESAATTNQFDETYSATLDTLLAVYQDELQTAYKASGDESVRTFLENAYESTAVLQSR